MRNSTYLSPRNAQAKPIHCWLPACLINLQRHKESVFNPWIDQTTSYTAVCAVLYLTKVCEGENVSQSSTVLHTVSLSRHILILRAQGGQHKPRPTAEGKIFIYQQQLHSCMYVLIYSILWYLNIQMYLKLTKNLYCRRTVKMKNTIPSIAMANRFFPTKSQDKGSRFCLVPVDINKMNSSSKLTVVHAYCRNICLSVRELFVKIPSRWNASAMAWFLAMSMRPRPRQKWGKIRKTFFRILLTSFKCWVQHANKIKMR